MGETEEEHPGIPHAVGALRLLRTPKTGPQALRLQALEGRSSKAVTQSIVAIGASMTTLTGVEAALPC